MDCVDCEEGLEHCHEVLVVHIDGTVECASGSCDGLTELHEWMAACTDLNWTCLCSRSGHSQPLAA